MSADTAHNMKTLAKAGAKAAAQDYIGAAVEVAKDPKLIKRIIAIILIPVLVFAVMSVLFLYSLPTMIFEAVATWFSAEAELFRQTRYDGQASTALGALAHAAGAVIKDVAVQLWGAIANTVSSLWDNVTEVTGKSVDSSDTKALREADFETEMSVTSIEEAETNTLWAKLHALQDKFDTRLDSFDTDQPDGQRIVRAIRNATVFAMPSSDDVDYYGYNKYDPDYCTLTHHYILGGYDISYSKGGRVSDAQAARIMSSYTSITGANITDLRLSDFQRWLGWNYGTNDKYKYTENGITVKVSAWNGTSMPAYLYDIGQYQKDWIKLLEGTDDAKNFWNGYEKENGRALVDFFVVLHLPNVSYLQPVHIDQSEIFTVEEGEWYVPSAHMTKAQLALAKKLKWDLRPYWRVMPEYQINYTYYFSTTYSASLRDISDISKIYGITGTPEADAEEQRLKATSGTGFLWPSYTQTITSTFGGRASPGGIGSTNHMGVDIGASYGTEIWATSPGTVTLAGYNGGYGYCVMIDHHNGYVSLYGHMSAVAVSVGQSVSQGSVIGYVGSTGNSTGPHIHFEIRQDGQAVDPMQFTFKHKSG